MESKLGLLLEAPEKEDMEPEYDGAPIEAARMSMSKLFPKMDADEAIAHLQTVLSLLGYSCCKD